MIKVFIYKCIPALVKHHRLRLGLSQKELAIKFGLDGDSGSQYVSNIERGLNTLPLEYWKIASHLFQVDIKKFMEEYLKDEQAKIDHFFNKKENIKLRCNVK